MKIIETKEHAIQMFNNLLELSRHKSRDQQGIKTIMDVHSPDAHLMIRLTQNKIFAWNDAGAKYVTPDNPLTFSIDDNEYNLLKARYDLTCSD